MTDKSRDEEKLEILISKLKSDIKEKDIVITSEEKVIKKLKEELEQKEKEIEEKDKVIDIMKHSFKCSDDEEEDSDDSAERYDSKADINNSDSTFDYAQLDISETDDLSEVKEKRSKATDKEQLCPQCQYKCKRKNTFRKHINTKHGDKSL